MSPHEVAFRFESPDLCVDFEGPEAFVEAQIGRLWERIQNELTAALARGRQTPGSPPRSFAHTSAATRDAPEPASPAAQDPATMTIVDFYKRARSREGRGALQETILIFAYYLRDVRGQAQFSIDELSSCFVLAGATAPSSLANTLGIMKRTQHFFDAGDRRGRYVLTDKGAAYVRRLIGAQ